MTKKYWADWQKRIGETKNIYLYHFIIITNKDKGNRTYYHSILSSVHGDDKILHATFYGDTVDLVIERHDWANGHYTVQNEYLTLHRNEISSIEFVKYYEN